MSRPHISTNILDRMRVFESIDSQCSLENNSSDTSVGSAAALRNKSEPLPNGRTITMMMPTPPPPPPPGVQTDANGLILPKKLINPCLESTDRKQLHRELKFNTKVGKNVLNQKSELQLAYEKQRERQSQHQLQHEHTPSLGLKGELNRVIMERALRHERTQDNNGGDNDNDDGDRQYVNPEYLNVRAKLRTGQRADMK